MCLYIVDMSYCQSVFLYYSHYLVEQYLHLQLFTNSYVLFFFLSYVFYTIFKCFWICYFEIIFTFQIFGNIYVQIVCVLFSVFFYINFDTPSTGGRGFEWVISIKIRTIPFGSFIWFYLWIVISMSFLDAIGGFGSMLSITFLLIW